MLFVVLGMALSRLGSQEVCRRTRIFFATLFYELFDHHRFLWENGATEASFVGPAGNHTVTVEDSSAACHHSTHATFTISQPAALNISLTSALPFCIGCNGTLTADVTGG